MPERSDIDAEGTIVTPVSVDTSRLELQADYFPCPIDLEALGAQYPKTQVLSADPFVLKLGGNAYVAVFHFGAVVFWKCDDAQCVSVLETIQRLPGMGPPSSEVRDRFLVVVGQAEERVNFRDIWLAVLTLEHIKIVSESFGQSVALRHSEVSVANALRSTTPIVRALEAHGELALPAKNVLKTVGFTMAIREAILAKLSVFDAPAETWRSERLARIHDLLHDHFDIEKRVRVLQDKVSFLSDLNMMLLSLLQNRTSHRLEWIVIILIVIEVIFSFYYFFNPAPH